MKQFLAFITFTTIIICTGLYSGKIQRDCERHKESNDSLLARLTSIEGIIKSL